MFKVISTYHCENKSKAWLGNRTIQFGEFDSFVVLLSEPDLINSILNNLDAKEAFIFVAIFTELLISKGINKYRSLKT